jgi:peptidoglycan hydrolase-like protein with peptidoglycan-binding domain
MTPIAPRTARSVAAPPKQAAKPAVATKAARPNDGVSTFVPSQARSTPAPGAQLIGLSRGTVNYGGSVSQLHNALLRLGYFPPSIRSDSGFGNTFGPKTQAAVLAFQRDQGLPVTGRVDAQTAAALVRAPARGPQAPAQPAPAQPAPAQPAPTTGSGSGVATSVEQANQSFLSQWGGTAWNSAHGAPAGYEDCGPTSCAMVLSSLGLIQQPSPGQAEATIGKLRDQAVGHATSRSEDTNDTELTRALKANGAQTQVVKATVDNVDQALAAGHPLIIGSSSTWAAWGQGQCAKGDYLNHRNPGGHFVTALGKTADGNYLVGDPLSRTGVIEVSKAQLQTLLSGAWNAIEVSR